MTMELDTAVVLPAALETGGISSPDVPSVSTGGLTSIDRLRLFESDPEQWPFERDDAENVLAMLDAMREQMDEANDILEERDERLTLVDRIADLIGLPQDQELDQVAFEIWFTNNKLRIETLQVALTPSAETKAAYWGEFSFPKTYTDEYGDEVTVTMNVPWTTIKEIMKAISNFAEAK